jgi:prepilin-type N-terminal cleavage/methylation domain-containing protein
LQLPPPDAILGSVCKDFKECTSIKRFHNKHNTNNIQNKILTHNSKAFTLAEVLIALVVIGIVAAITVPTLIQRYQDQAIKSALKKNYAVLKSALDKYQIENGERVLPSDYGNHKLKPALIKYFNVSKDCNAQDCYSAANVSLYKNYIGSSTRSTYFDDGQFILNDGSLIFFENDSLSSTNASKRLYISVDVNGYEKKPNRLGKDLFMFQLMDNGDLLPMGAKGTDYRDNLYCSNTLTNYMNGAGCTAKILKE